MKLFVFGLGYSALRYVATLPAGVAVAGTVRTHEKARMLTQRAIEAFVFDGGERGEDVAASLREANVVLASAPPAADGDPALARYGADIATSPALRAIVYLSTIAVYGDCGGARIDETALPRPTSERGRARVSAEDAWRRVATTAGASLASLRLAGIYGPGRNVLVKLREGSARRIVKPAQTFNRIHVDDIAAAIAGVVGRRADGDFNIADDEPAPPQDVIAYAAALLGLPPPPEEDFATADMTPMARGFYSDNKRIDNTKMKRDLGVALAFPSYREGLSALAAAGE